MQKRTLFQSATWIYMVPIFILIAYRFIFPAHICDDAYISFKTAMNLGDGFGMNFNFNENAYVVTTPLWVLLLAGLRMIFGDIIIAAKVLGILFESLLLVSLVHLGKTLTGSRIVGLLTALFICTNPVFLLTSFSGMELALYLFIISLTFNLTAGRHDTIALLTATLAVWVRFDGIVLLGTVSLWVIFQHRETLLRLKRLKFKGLGKLLLKFLPAGTVVAAYMLFGLLYYDSIIPMSVQIKIAKSPALFSKTWTAGAGELFLQFYNAFVGLSAYWYVAGSMLILLIVPFILGLIHSIARKNREVVPLFLFTLLYIAAFIKGGAMYARNFPWYFVPILPAAYLSAAIGCKELARWAGGQSPRLERLCKHRAVIISSVLIWAVIMGFTVLSKDSRRLAGMYQGREKVYATAMVWLGKNLDTGYSKIAANEIGTVGFFGRPRTKIIDMFGILRSQEEKGISFIELLKRYRPAAILTKQNFVYKKTILKHIKNQYTWINFNHLEIGLRKDIAPKLLPGHRRQLKTIYRRLNSFTEYPWPLASYRVNGGK